MNSSDFEKIDIYVSCRNLRNKDALSKSDPQVRVYAIDRGTWKMFSRTEIQRDNLNPNFETTFALDFVFEIQQPLKFEVVDVDPYDKCDIIGSVETTLGAIMGARKQTLSLDLKDPVNKNAGKIILIGEKAGEPRSLIFWQWSAVQLTNPDGWFNKSDPVLRFYKQRAGGNLLQVHETEVAMSNSDPVWNAFQITDSKLCTDHLQWFRVEVWDWTKSGKYEYMGQVNITLDMIKRGPQFFELYNVKRACKVGNLQVSNFNISPRPSFVDYLRGGTQLNAIVAVDFTASNGQIGTPDSLHAIYNNGALNQYQKAITGISQVVFKYDFDQKVPVYGFGAKPHFTNYSQNSVSHCFPLTGNKNQQEVTGLKGVLDVYQNALKNVELSGPTLFAPLLHEAIKVCEANRQMENDIYSILLIVTDGEIHDMDQTVDAIIKAAYLPLSVIIVGVGNSDFGKMEKLDGDQGLCNARGQRALRDLVQFVAFRDFNNDMDLLSQRVLAELPNQVVEYMRLVNRKPKAPQKMDINRAELFPTQPNPNYNQQNVERFNEQFTQLNVSNQEKVKKSGFYGNQYEQDLGYSGYNNGYNSQVYGSNANSQLYGSNVNSGLYGSNANSGFYGQGSINNDQYNSNYGYNNGYGSQTRGW